jgi:hypothetical protein
LISKAGAGGGQDKWGEIADAMTSVVLNAMNKLIAHQLVLLATVGKALREKRVPLPATAAQSEAIRLTCKSLIELYGYSVNQPFVLHQALAIDAFPAKQVRAGERSRISRAHCQ